MLLSGGLDSSLIVGLLAQEGQTGLATYSIGFESVGGQEGDEFAYSDVIAEHFGTDHHRIRVGSDELAGALGHAIGAMAEPMVSHDVVAFDLLSERVSETIRVVQSGQGADEVFAGYHWYPPLAGARPRGRRSQTYAQRFFDRDHAAHARGRLRPVRRWPRTRAWRSSARTCPRPGAETAVDAALRLDSEIMLVDDPVKRVDNMSMAWGLEARVPVPRPRPGRAAPRCARRSSSSPTAARACSRRSDGGSSRPRSSTGPRATSRCRRSPTSRARCSTWSATPWPSDAARDRGLFRPEYVRELLADPNGELTPLKGNKLWQLGLLELWLQTHGV